MLRILAESALYMRHSHVGSDNSNMVETLLKITQGQGDPIATTKDNVVLAQQMAMQDRRI